jgi:hypothetical protein
MKGKNGVGITRHAMSFPASVVTSGPSLDQLSLGGAAAWAGDGEISPVGLNGARKSPQ